MLLNLIWKQSSVTTLEYQRGVTEQWENWGKGGISGCKSVLRQRFDVITNSNHVFKGATRETRRTQMKEKSDRRTMNWKHPCCSY